MKRLNFVSRYFFPDSPGGCEKVFYEVYKRAVKDYSVKVISSYENKNKFPKNNDLFKKKDYKNKLVRYSYYTRNLSMKALNNKCDLIHSNNIECVRLSKTPFVLTIHHVGHFIDSKIRKQTLFNKMMKRMLVLQANRADKVITVSNSTRKDLVKIGVKKEKIIVIPNGIDLKIFKPLKKKKNKKFIISHVARISPEKGQDFTIKAFYKLPKSIRDNMEIRFIGFVSDKEYYKYINRKFFKYYTNLSEKILVEKINESDLIIYPTLMSEGFGLVVLEAMACGVPIIASDQPSIREAGGKVCQYFKQGDQEDFIKKILQLYKNKSLRNKLVKKGLERVKKFSWDKVYTAHKKLYEDLLK